mgnify:CR=1 FL=1
MAAGRLNVMAADKRPAVRRRSVVPPIQKEWQEMRRLRLQPQPRRDE